MIYGNPSPPLMSSYVHCPDVPVANETGNWPLGHQLSHLFLQPGILLPQDSTPCGKGWKRSMARSVSPRFFGASPTASDVLSTSFNIFQLSTLAGLDPWRCGSYMLAASPSYPWENHLALEFRACFYRVLCFCPS